MSADGWRPPAWVPPGVVIPAMFPVLGSKALVIPRDVQIAAYEVYAKVEGPQISLVTVEHRGGFSVAELAAYLYARSFPEAEWSARVDRALRRGAWADASAGAPTAGGGR